MPRAPGFVLVLLALAFPALALLALALLALAFPALALLALALLALALAEELFRILDFLAIKRLPTQSRYAHNKIILKVFD